MFEGNGPDITNLSVSTAGIIVGGIALADWLIVISIISVGFTLAVNIYDRFFKRKK